MTDIAENCRPANAAGTGSLAGLVAGLPDIYQPVFGHPELSAYTTRTCEDRLAHIVPIYRALESGLGRPLYVLDLGCAQGFFSLHLARLGAVVHGIDCLDLNITVCNALAAECPELKATFQTGNIADVINPGMQDRYDLVLSLSVLHHLIHGKGVAFVEEMLALLAQRTMAGIFEIALANEPTKLRYAHPQNPRDLLNSYTFVAELAQIPTQMMVIMPPSWTPSVICRPLYVASNRYKFLGGRMEAIEDV